MVWEATHWKCSVCKKEIPRDQIYIDVETDALICKNCIETLRKKEKEQMEEGGERRG